MSDQLLPGVASRRARASTGEGPEEMNEDPQYVVTVEQVEDIEDLRNWAYAAAHSSSYATTEHWDDWEVPKQPGVRFYFKAYGAALRFIVHCKLSGIPCGVEW